MKNVRPEARAGEQFPTTMFTAIAAVRSQDSSERRRALDSLIAVYWKPVYKYVRLKWHKTDEDARDLTQSFFTRAIERNDFAPYDPAKARFRTYVRVCVDAFIANANRAAGRLKRGGNLAFQSLDFAGADREYVLQIAAVEAAPDEYFEQEWMRSLFTLAVAELERQYAAKGKQAQFRLFRRYDLADDTAEAPSYRILAEEFGIDLNTVTNRLAAARRDFRRIVLDTLRAISADDAEYRAEARRLFGVQKP